MIFPMTSTFVTMTEGKKNSAWIFDLAYLRNTPSLQLTYRYITLLAKHVVLSYLNNNLVQTTVLCCLKSYTYCLVKFLYMAIMGDCRHLLLCHL